MVDTAQEPWTVGRCFEWTVAYFERLGVPQPRVSAEWLVTSATGLERIDLIIKADLPLEPVELATIREGIQRRVTGEPLQYITGETAFRQLSIACEPGVLIPRPETELLVDCVLEYLDRNVTGWVKPRRKRVQLPWNAEVEAARQAELAARAEAEQEDGEAAEGGETERDASDGECAIAAESVAAENAPAEQGVEDAGEGAPLRCARVLEVGCGTGCISLSMVSERPGCVSCVATDISEEAVSLARRNRERLRIAPEVLDIRLGDLVQPVLPEERSSFDVLVSNPPYVPTAVLEAIPHEVRDFEPHLALDGGEDGLEIFRRLVSVAPYVLKQDGLLACELFEDSLKEAAAIARNAGMHDVRIIEDLTGRQRFLFAHTG